MCVCILVLNKKILKVKKIKKNVKKKKLIECGYKENILARLKASGLYSNMAQNNSPNKITARNYRRNRTKFIEDQLNILIKAFNQTPYPGDATKRNLALEINTEESRIQIWFQNRRARHRVQKRSEPEKDRSTPRPRSP